MKTKRAVREGALDLRTYLRIEEWPEYVPEDGCEHPYSGHLSS
jgi:hypothetical protein